MNATTFSREELRKLSDVDLVSAFEAACSQNNESDNRAAVVALRGELLLRLRKARP